jgi:hypothetical protein
VGLATKDCVSTASLRVRCTFIINEIFLITVVCACQIFYVIFIPLSEFYIINTDTRLMWAYICIGWG